MNLKPGRKGFMHTAIIALVERMMRSEELLVVGLGDSLTYGWEVERGFFDRFVDMLGDRYPNARIRRHNAGIPGDTADGGLARLGRVLDLKPDLVIVQFALNDAFSGVDPRDFEGSMQSIAARVLELPAAVILVTSCALEREHDAAIVRPFYDAIIRVEHSSRSRWRSWTVSGQRALYRNQAPYSITTTGCIPMTRAMCSWRKDCWSFSKTMREYHECLRGQGKSAGVFCKRAA